MITIVCITIFIALQSSTWLNCLLFSTPAQRIWNYMSTITLLKVTTPWSTQELAYFQHFWSYFFFPYATHGIISTKINSFISSKILNIPLMFLSLTTIDELSQLDLKPIHSSVSFLYLPQRFLLIGLQEYLNQLVEIINLFLIFSQSILSQGSQVLFDLIPQYYPIIFDQL